jgi:predicted DNA-binding transcriptional regulator AlpA
MTAPLPPYPCVWADAKTVSELFCLAESTFRDHVASGLLPQGVRLGGKRLWRVSQIDEALAKLLPSEKDGDRPGNDPVLDAIGRAKDGQATKGRRRNAA